MVIRSQRTALKWKACWHTSFSKEEPGQDPTGTAASTDAYDAFVKAKRLIKDENEDEDEAVIGTAVLLA